MSGFHSHQRKGVKRRSNSSTTDPKREKRCFSILNYRMEVKE
jgi:hypothetical protein